MTLEKIFEHTPGLIIQLKIQYDSVNHFKCTLSVHEDNKNSGYMQIVSQRDFKDKNLNNLLSKVYAFLDKRSLISC